MPPETADRPRTPANPAEARQRAHDALDRAFTTRTVRGEESTGVNLSLLTDQLRYEGVPIEVRRRDRGTADPSAEAATKSVGAATAGRPAHYGRPAAAERAAGAAPFGSGSTVRTVPGAATDVPDELEGEVRQVFKQGGVWLADVQWANGAISEGMDCGVLELASTPMPAFRRAMASLADELEADRPRQDAEFRRQLYTDGGVPSISGRLARGEVRPPWWGETPAEGTRRKLLGDVLRAEDVLSETEVRDFADALELALLEVEKVNSLFGLDHDGEQEGDRALTVDRLVDVYDALDRLDAPAGTTPAARIDRLYEELRPVNPSDVEAELVKANRQLVDAGNELDRVCIPRAIDTTVLELPARVGVLVQRALVAQAVRHAAGDLPERLAEGEGWHGTEPAEGTRRALIRDAIKELFERQSIGVSTPLAIADAVESALLRWTIEAEDAAGAIENVVTVAGEGPPSGLRYSERQIWQRGDGDHRLLLDRLARLRAGIADEEARDGELRVVLEDISPADQPPEYRFIELEDGQGRGVSFPMVPSSRQPFLEIVIPPPNEASSEYSGDGLSEATGARIAKALETLTTSAGGALRELLDRTATDGEARQ